MISQLVSFINCGALLIVIMYLGAMLEKLPNVMYLIVVVQL